MILFLEPLLHGLLAMSALALPARGILSAGTSSSMKKQRKKEKKRKEPRYKQHQTATILLHKAVITAAVGGADQLVPILFLHTHRGACPCRAFFLQLPTLTNFDAEICACRARSPSHRKNEEENNTMAQQYSSLSLLFHLSIWWPLWCTRLRWDMSRNTRSCYEVEPEGVLPCDVSPCYNSTRQQSSWPVTHRINTHTRPTTLSQKKIERAHFGGVNRSEKIARFPSRSATYFFRSCIILFPSKYYFKEPLGKN